MPHIKCKRFPVHQSTNKKFKEEDYIQIYAKAMAKFRYEIYQLVKGKNIELMNQEERNA